MRNKLIAAILLLPLLLGACSGKESSNYNRIEEQTPKDYFAELPRGSSIPIVKCRDFDNDGDDDFIIVQQDSRAGCGTRAYYFENNGYGNFRLKKYSPEDVSKVE